MLVLLMVGALSSTTRTEAFMEEDCVTKLVDEEYEHVTDDRRERSTEQRRNSDRSDGEGAVDARMSVAAYRRGKSIP